ncbi:IS5 family transposase [Streptomyces xanthochromogenes]|uniref:IS5 family transposase n=1 Tax=Streptomyces xanthochromogenes TaxID=67384 RepID=UPI00343C0EF2
MDQSVVGPGVPLTDAQWARIEPLLSDRTPKWVGRWRGHREAIDEIAFKFQTGTQWVHLPEKYSNWRGIHNRLRMWAVDGTWERVFTALVAQADADEDVSWAVVRGLHDRARSPTRCRSPQNGAPAGEPGHHAVGRSRGGLTTTIHFAADGHCRPLVFVLGPGQAGDAPAFTDVMARLCVPRSLGRPRTRPDLISAGKAYSSRVIRDHSRRRDIRAVIPERADQQANRRRRGPAGGRPPACFRRCRRRQRADLADRRGLTASTR